MGLLTFLGGIHPYEGKELSMEKPVKEYLPKGFNKSVAVELVFFLQRIHKQYESGRKFILTTMQKQGAVVIRKVQHLGKIGGEYGVFS